jgi:DNA primase
MRDYSAVKEEIKRKLDIVDVIHSYVPNLKRAGRNYTTLCPFHEEDTPSFTVSPDKQMYKCFGCNVGGDIFTFVMKLENISFPEVIKLLGEKAGIPDYDLHETVEQAADRKEKELIYSALQKAAQFYHNNLFRSKEAMAYLEKREISQNTAAEFCLGYAPGGKVLFSELKKDFDTDIIEKAGLIYPATQKHAEISDYFRGRILFPFFDSRKRVIGFSGRVLDDDQEPKYLNSEETPVFRKREQLYGLYNSGVMPEIRNKKSVFIVEGFMDDISLYQRGLKNVVATAGTSFTEEQASLIKRIAPKAVICLDPDKAGINAAITGGQMLMKSGLMTKIMLLDYGDPDEFVKLNGIEEFNKYAENATSLFEFKLKNSLEKIALNSCDSSLSLIKEMVPFISDAPSQTQQYLYLKKLSETTKSDFKTLIRAMHDFSSGKGMNFNLEDRLEEELLHMMIKFPSSVENVKKNISSDCFGNKTYGIIFSCLSENTLKNANLLENNKNLFTESIENDIVNETKKYSSDVNEEEVIKFLARAAVSESKTQESLEAAVLNVKMKHYRKKVLSIREKIRSTDNEDEMNSLLDEYAKIENELNK